MSKGVCLIPNNTRPNAAAATLEMIDSFRWEVCDDPLVSQDLSYSDYQLVPKLQEFLGGVCLDSEKDNRSVTSMAGNFYDGIKKLVSRYD